MSHESFLPDELWRKIILMGIDSSNFGPRELCCLSISSRLFRRLSAEPSPWSKLIARDFPTCTDPKGSSASSSKLPSDQPSSPKSLYKTKFERDRARKLADWRFEVLLQESQIAGYSRKVTDARRGLLRENGRLKEVKKEIANLENARRASVALNVWQPEAVRSSHRNLVQQNSVSIDSRITALQMEIKVCKCQIDNYSKAYNNNKKKLDELKNSLASLKYHPIETFVQNKNLEKQNKKRKTEDVKTIHSMKE